MLPESMNEPIEGNEIAKLLAEIGYVDCNSLVKAKIAVYTLKRVKLMIAKKLAANVRGLMNDAYPRCLVETRIAVKKSHV